MLLARVWTRASYPNAPSMAQLINALSANPPSPWTTTETALRMALLASPLTPQMIAYASTAPLEQCCKQTNALVLSTAKIVRLTAPDVPMGISSHQETVWITLKTVKQLVATGYV